MNFLRQMAGGLSMLILLFLTGISDATTYYVWQDSPANGPGDSWADAFHDIQSAVNVTTDGDTVVVTNGIYNTGGIVAPGNYLTNRLYITNSIRLQSVNGPGVTMICGANFFGQGPSFTNNVRCVYITNNAVLSGFTLTNGGSWNASSYPPIFGPSDLSGGGVYGGTVTNCILSGNQAYGDGGGAHGCSLINCLLTNNGAPVNNGGGGGASVCTLVNCVLTRNFAAGSGGGAVGGTLTGCALMGNSATVFGGGAEGSALTNCFISGNSAPSHYGGGADSSTLNNCIIIRNTAEVGGGVYDSDLNNCLVSFNSALAGGGIAATYNKTKKIYNCTIVSNSGPYGGGGVTGPYQLYNCILYNNTASMYPALSNYDGGQSFYYCCTAPLPTNGLGNISMDPLLINLTSGNCRLQSNSPCINAGNNVFLSGSVDLDGRPRVVGGTVDMGCYEFQGPGVGEFTGWLQQYGLATDGSADYADSDGTGMNNWQKWIAGLDPTNPSSVLAMSSLAVSNSTGVTVTWQSVSNRTYYLQRSSNLSGAPAFTSVQSNIVGQAGVTIYNDTTATGLGPYYYRIGVQ